MGSERAGNGPEREVWIMLGGYCEPRRVPFNRRQHQRQRQEGRADEGGKIVGHAIEAPSATAEYILVTTARASWAGSPVPQQALLQGVFAHRLVADGLRTRETAAATSVVVGSLASQLRLILARAGARAAAAVVSAKSARLMKLCLARAGR